MSRVTRPLDGRLPKRITLMELHVDIIKAKTPLRLVF